MNEPEKIPENNQDNIALPANELVLKFSEAVKELEDRMKIKNTERLTATAIKLFKNFVFSKLDCGKVGEEYMQIFEAAYIVGLEHSEDQKTKSEMNLLTCVIFPDGFEGYLPSGYND